MGTRPCSALLAIDLDGTLLGSDEVIARADRAAIERARSMGYEPVIATGRFPGRSFAAARGIACRMPLICADGSLLVLPDAPPRLVRGLDLPRVESVTELCDGYGLRTFLFSHDAWHCKLQHRSYSSYVSGWSHGACERPLRDRSGVVLALGLGDPDSVHAALAGAAALALEEIFCDEFPLAPSDLWAVRFRHGGASKGVALAELAEEHGIGRDRIVAVGNDYNDLSLFEVAGLSFAMADSPPRVLEAATHRLAATSEKGGGVAEAVARLARFV